MIPDWIPAAVIILNVSALIMVYLWMQDPD